MRPLPTALALVVTLALAACGAPKQGSDGGTDGGNLQSLGLQANWSSIQSNLIPSCTLGNPCHASANGNTPTGHVTLNATVAYDNLVGQPSTEIPSLNLVEPGHPELSYIVNKLDGTQKGVCTQNGQPTFVCGLQMPNGGPYLSPSDIDAIKTWITNGAQNN